MFDLLPFFLAPTVFLLVILWFQRKFYRSEIDTLKKDHEDYKKTYKVQAEAASQLPPKVAEKDRVLWKIGDRVEVDLTPSGDRFTIGTIVDFLGEDSDYDLLVKLEGAKEFPESEKEMDEEDRRLGIHDQVTFRDIRKVV